MLAYAQPRSHCCATVLEELNLSVELRGAPTLLGAGVRDGMLAGAAAGALPSLRSLHLTGSPHLDGACFPRLLVRLPWRSACGCSCAQLRFC
jgi:hypothetical protein